MHNFRSVFALCLLTASAMAASPEIAQVEAALVQLDAIFDRAKLTEAGVERPKPVTAAEDISAPAGTYLRDSGPRGAPPPPKLYDYERRRLELLRVLYRHADRLAPEDRIHVESEAHIRMARFELAELRPEPARKAEPKRCGGVLDWLGRWLGG